MRKEQSNFLILAGLLLVVWAFNVIRIDLIDFLIQGGYIVKDSKGDALSTYMTAAVVDASLFLVLLTSPGWWIKWVTKPIMGLLVASGFLHAYGLYTWAYGIHFEYEYKLTSEIFMALTFLILILGGYGNFKRDRTAPGHRRYAGDPVSGNMATDSRSKNRV